MDYKPRYVQPFTLTEAIALDVPVITEEITRLRNSIQRLNDTQSILEKILTQPGGKDPEMSQAFEENKTVIGSQQERITILEQALREKGVVLDGHYSLSTGSKAAGDISSSGSASNTGRSTDEISQPDVEDDGVYL
ncbi:hypothetical protein CVT24_004016 [Panaeolus cyanescens]|uniref:Uncharacterized protein n=1 Tax=Panaeolus cyanescens TaxID=181874 RepID=A0A409Y651_9AGAR|nr:hypothetical protein CVT24_004016 [Panaeolus cyanescens]